MKSVSLTMTFAIPAFLLAAGTVSLTWAGSNEGCANPDLRDMNTYSDPACVRAALARGQNVNL